MTSIEEAIASLGTAPAAAEPIKSPVLRRIAANPDLKQRSEAAVPSPDDDWRAKLHGAMTETGLTFSADAIAQSEAALVNGELQITAPKQFQLDLGRDEIQTALKHLGFPALRFKVNFGEVKAAPARDAEARAKKKMKSPSARWRIRKCSVFENCSAAKCAPSAT